MSVRYQTARYPISASWRRGYLARSISSFLQAHSAGIEYLGLACSSGGFNDRAWLARNLVQVRPNEERLSLSARPAGGSVSACLLVLLYALAGQRPVARSGPSTKIVAASIVLTCHLWFLPIIRLPYTYFQRWRTPDVTRVHIDAFLCIERIPVQLAN